MTEHCRWIETHGRRRRCATSSSLAARHRPGYRHPAGPRIRRPYRGRPPKILGTPLPPRPLPATATREARPAACRSTLLSLAAPRSSGHDQFVGRYRLCVPQRSPVHRRRHVGLLAAAMERSTMPHPTTVPQRPMARLAAEVPPPRQPSWQRHWEQDLGSLGRADRMETSQQRPPTRPARLAAPSGPPNRTALAPAPEPQPIRAEPSSSVLNRSASRG